MVVLFKGIKPTRLKDDAMRLALLNAMREYGTKVKKDFEQTVETWKHKPKFETLVSLKEGAEILVDTATESKIYGYVTEGTPPHLIWAGHYTGKSKSKVLAIPTAFSPKTQPGRLKAGAGSRSGKAYFRPYVQHPGIKPRLFHEMIAKEHEKPYKRFMEKAMKEVAQASGHAM